MLRNAATRTMRAIASRGLGATWASVAAGGAAPVVVAAVELRSPLLTAVRQQQQQSWAALALLQQRGYAKQYAPAGAYANPQDKMRPGSVRVTMISSNLLAEPYKGEPPRLPLISWFTISGWKERWRRALGGAKSLYTVSKCKKNVPDFGLPAFKEEALQLYETICRMLAEGDRTGLRQLVAPSVFGDMKRQLKQREEGGWARVAWALTQRPTLKEMELCHARLIALDPKDDNTGFAQLTVRVPSRQRFAAYSRAGRLVAGSETEDVAVVDHWVFEIPLRKQSSNRWRLAGRLSVPADGKAPVEEAAAPAAAKKA